MDTKVTSDAASVESAAALLQRFGSRSVLTEPADTLRYRRDWHGDVEGSAVAVLRPADTAEASEMVRFCAEHGLAVVPQGGNTGLVLGALPTSARGHVVVSLERMNRIRGIDAADFSAVVEAGCVLSAIKEAAEAEDLFFPLSLGSEGSCQIGGNISTNAGGINVLRYGMTREMILGLEVVLADGTVWNGLSTLRKNNSGLDLKQLFIGAEGTLGLVTAAAIRLAPAGAGIVDETRVAHSAEAVAAGLAEMIDRNGADLAVVFGASAIADRRDVIPVGIEMAGGRVDHLGMPVDPGNLLLLGSRHGVPVIGAPGCARSPKENGFDWILHRLLADVPVTRADIVALGVGGLLMEIVSRPQPRAGGETEPVADE